MAQIEWSPIDTRSREQRAEDAREEAKEAAEDRREARRARLARERRERAELESRALDEAVRAERARLQRSIDRDLAEQAEECRDGALRNVRKNLERSILNSPTTADRIKAEREALAASRRAGQWDQVSRELRAASVVSEPPLYGRHSEHSWFMDSALVSVPAHQQSHGLRQARAAAEKRLGRHDRAEMLNDPLRAERTLRDLSRMEITFRQQSEERYKELRTGMTSGTAGSFLTPGYLLADYAVYREYAPVFAEVGCTQKPLPSYGLKVYVPLFTADADGGVQSSEGSAISEVDPTATLGEADLKTLESYVNCSQQLVDRVGPGHGLDEFLFAQIRQKLDQQLDLQAITAALTGVTVGTRASFTANEVADGYLSDLGQMAASLETTAGVKLPPTAQFVQPAWGEWLLSQTGTNHEPLFPFVAGTGDRADGFSGYAPSNVPLYLDGTIPASSGDAQLIVANDSGTYLYVGEPMFDFFPEPGAADLAVLVRGYRYFAVLQRYPGAVAATSGAAYTLTPTWA